MPTWNFRVDACRLTPDTRCVEFAYTQGRGNLPAEPSGQIYEFKNVQELRDLAAIDDADILQMLRRMFLARALLANINAPSDLNGHSVSLTITAAGGSITFA